MDPEVGRKNVRWGIALLALALVLFAGSIALAEIYSALAS